MSILAYKPNRSGSLIAVYRGEVRIGYITTRDDGGYIWQLSMLRPQGGARIGVASTLPLARAACTSEFKRYLREAGLEEAA